MLNYVLIKRQLRASQTTNFSGWSSALDASGADPALCSCWSTGRFWPPSEHSQVRTHCSTNPGSSIPHPGTPSEQLPRAVFFCRPGLVKPKQPEHTHKRDCSWAHPPWSPKSSAARIALPKPVPSPDGFASGSKPPEPDKAPAAPEDTEFVWEAEFTSATACLARKGIFWLNLARLPCRPGRRRARERKGCSVFLETVIKPSANWFTKHARLLGKPNQF